jgi:hypothetical protein
MARKRPTAVLVMAILNFVIGGGGFLCSLCNGIGVAFLALLVNQPGMANDPDIRELREVFSSMMQHVPLFMPFAISSTVAGLLMNILLIVAGIGLLKMGRWGRTLCIVYGVVQILIEIGELVFRIVYLNPAIEQWNRNFAAPHGPMRAQANNPFLSNPAANSAIEVVGTIFGMAYAIALLIIMFLPHVSAAFSRGDIEDYERRQLAEEEEGGYERREPQEGGWGEGG